MQVHGHYSEDSPGYGPWLLANSHDHFGLMDKLLIKEQSELRKLRSSLQLERHLGVQRVGDATVRHSDSLQLIKVAGRGLTTATVFFRGKVQSIAPCAQNFPLIQDHIM